MVQFYKINKNNWIEFDNGSSIGKRGSEDGAIIFDIEHNDGARITIEKECGKIPFAITLGIYGLLFHTEFFGEAEEVKNYVERKTVEIDEILILYLEKEEITEEISQLIEKLVE